MTDNTNATTYNGIRVIVHTDIEPYNGLLPVTVPNDVPLVWVPAHMITRDN